MGPNGLVISLFVYGKMQSFPVPLRAHVTQKEGFSALKVYRKNTKKWNGPYEVAKVSNKIISLTDVIKVKKIQHNISSTNATKNK